MVAARAMEQALRIAHPDLTVEVVDVLSVASGFFRRLYAGGYLSLVRRAPVLMGLLYEQMDQPAPNLADRARLMIQNAHAPRIARYILSRRPRLIVNTHFLPAEIVAQLRRRGKLDCPQATVTTDFETHRLWVQEPTDCYFVAGEMGRALLSRWGVDERKIRVTGIPVRREFNVVEDRSALRSQLGLAPDRPVTLLLCGGFGVGPVVQLLSELLTLPRDVQIIAVCGRNDALRERLTTLATGEGARCRVVGFTDEMHCWMQAADIVVTKPGGLTSSEALACGLPLVIVNPIPGQEARNSDFLLECGAAVKSNDIRLIGHRVRVLLDAPDRLNAMRKAALSAARPEAAASIARELGQMLAPQAV